MGLDSPSSVAFEAKPQVWKECGEAMEKHFQLALKNEWNTVRKQLLTLIVVSQWYT